MTAMRKKERIGEVIKSARLKLKLSAEEVGHDCNVSRSRVYQWEAQRYVFPKNLPVLAEVLRLPLTRLMRVNGKPQRQ